MMRDFKAAWLAEQSLTVTELDTLHAEMDALLPAILDRAFKGEL